MNLEKLNFINSNISTIVAKASHYYRPLGRLPYVILLVFSHMFFVSWTCILERTIFNIFSSRGQLLPLLSKNNIMCVLRCFSAWMFFVIICIIYVSVRLARFSILLLC
jgi:hypothetical protein